MKLNLDDLHVDTFTAGAVDGTEPVSEIHLTVLRHTEKISCYVSDCGTCGGTDCWV